MQTYYDENFGHWDMDSDPDALDFYRECQRRSKETTCQGCKRTVRLLPHYNYCSGCCDRIERGWDL